jgi:hypothetical protein
MGFRRSLVRIQSPRFTRAADSQCQRLFSFVHVGSYVDVRVERPANVEYLRVGVNLHGHILLEKVIAKEKDPTEKGDGFGNARSTA